MDWPIKINVRRTTVIDDNNKEILTTAMGRGYESQEYVLGSAVSAKQAELEIAISERDSTIARLREAIQKHKKAFDEEDLTVEDQMLWDVLKESGDG